MERRDCVEDDSDRVMLAAWLCCRTVGCAAGAGEVFERSFSRYAACVTVGSEVFRAVQAVLSRRGSECQRHVPEGGQKRERRGQMQHHAAHRDDHAGRPASAPVPAASRPEASAVGVSGAQAQLLHQHVGCDGQQHAELIGPEMDGTGAVDLKNVRFLDPVLDFAALAVDLLVKPLRTLCHVGNDEARVVFGLFAFAAQHLGLDQDAAFSLLVPGRAVGFAVNMSGLAGHSGECAGILHGLFRLALQHRVFRHRNDIFDAGLGIQKVERRGCAKPPSKRTRMRTSGKSSGPLSAGGAESPPRPPARSRCRGAAQPHKGTVRLRR